jgi:hypothetical protein
VGLLIEDTVGRAAVRAGRAQPLLEGGDGRAPVAPLQGVALDAAIDAPELVAHVLGVLLFDTADIDHDGAPLRSRRIRRPPSTYRPTFPDMCEDVRPHPPDDGATL